MVLELELEGVKDWEYCKAKHYEEEELRGLIVVCVYVCMCICVCVFICVCVCVVVLVLAIVTYKFLQPTRLTKDLLQAQF